MHNSNANFNILAFIDMVIQNYKIIDKEKHEKTRNAKRRLLDR